MSAYKFETKKTCADLPEASEKQAITSSSSVICFSSANKNKKLIEAKKKVYQASSKLGW
ncbi:MAG: hypothetical protein KGZ39_04960 [Simkania sp.]|nr:hypothetical protein [Simkania sp.]